MTKDKRPMLVELQWVHPCFAIKSTEKVQEGRISLLSSLAYGKGFATGLYELETDKNVDELVKKLQGQKEVKEVRVVDRSADGKKALIYARTKPDSLLIETIAKTGCVPLEPSLTKAGVDSCAIFVPNEEQLRELYGLLKDKYDTKLLRKKFLSEGQTKAAAYVGLRELLEFKSLSARLSPRQYEVFTFAAKKGYFDTPRRVDIDALASALGLSPATASEHLRKAQAKILPFVAELMGNVR